MQIIPLKSLPFFQKRKDFFIWLAFLLITLGLFGLTAKNWSQSFKFVDEDEYIANAYLMSEKGYVLYESISTNHQPLPYILSIFVQENFEAENLYQLILSHRMFVWGWALLWSVILYFRFGKKILLPLLIFESIKYFTLGNQFVAESLVAYPLAYISASFFQFMVDDHFYNEDFFLGILSSVCVFFLLPLSIPILLMHALRYYFSKLKESGEFIKGFAVMALFVFFFVHPFDWIRETVWNNARYAIPIISEVGSIWDFLKLFSLPLTSILTKKTILSYWTALTSIFWWVSLAVLIKKEQTKQILMWIVSFVIWGLANSRNLNADQMYYNAFHLNPWMIMGLIWGWWWLKYIENKKLLTIGLLASIILFLSPQMPWREKKDPATDHQIGYTQMYEMGRVISLLSRGDNRLMVIPNEALLHTTSKTDLATRQITYYEWHYHVPELQNTFSKTLEMNLPEFIYFDESKSSYDIPIKNILNRNYIQYYSTANNPTLLYQRSDIVETIPKRIFIGLEALGYLPKR